MTNLLLKVASDEEEAWRRYPDSPDLWKGSHAGEREAFLAGVKFGEERAGELAGEEIVGLTTALRLAEQTLRDIARQTLVAETAEDQLDNIEDGYDECIRVARRALKGEDK